MSTTNPTISSSSYVSSVSNSRIGGGSSMDIMSYVEMMLVQDYDSQLKDMATSIKINNALKGAYRDQKVKVNELLKISPDKDGYVKLNPEQKALLDSAPNYQWDSSANNNLGGIMTTTADGKATEAGISNAAYTEVSNNGSAPLAANETATWEGDPHFKDADGGKFDFQGKAGESYTYVKDYNFTFDATHIAYGKNGACVVGKVDLKFEGPNKTSSIGWDAKGTPTLNGDAMTKGKTYQLADGGSAVYDGTSLTVTSGEGYTVKIDDKGGYFDGSVRSPSKGVAQDGNMATGIIGSQFDADDKSGQVDGNAFKTTAPAASTTKDVKVKVDTIKAEIDRLQMKLDGFNSETELAQTDISTITSQRKLAFETMSTMASKVFEGASEVIRNIK